MTGSIVTFDDAIPFMPIEKLVAYIEPQQDLHGYDAPWAGGSGKNLLDATQSEEGGIDADGVEVSGNVYWRSSNYIPVKANTSYALWANNNWTVLLYWYDANKTFISPRVSGNQGGKAIGVSPSNAVYARWSVYYANNAFTYDDIINSQLQLEEGTSATAWTPYSNICPITGWTGLSGERDGKNLFDTATAGNEWVTSGGYITTKDSAKSVRLDCKAGEVFTLSNKNTASGTNILVIACFDSNNTMLSREVVSATVKSVTATVPNGASFLIACFNDWSLVEEAQLEVGSTATAYEAPVTSLPITVSWQTEAGTIYDGYIDVVSGVLTVDTAVETENGGNPYWQLNTGGVGRFYLPSLPSGLDTSRKAESICNVLTYKDDNTVYGSFFVYGGSGLYVNKISADETLEQFKTRISNPALQIIYPLAQPQTYQLTPQQISTLLGQNNIWVDTGDVSVTYQSTSGSTPVRTSFKSPLKNYSYSSLKLFNDTFIEHGKG